MDESDEDALAFKAGVILLSSLAVGTSVKALARFTGYGRPFVAERVRRLRENGVFTRSGKVASDWFSENGGTAFMCDTLVAEGLFNRAK